MKRRLSYVISADCDGLMIKAFLKRKGYSSSVLTMLKKEEDGVVLNGERVFVTRMLSVGDRLDICMTDSDTSAEPEPIEVPILFEDEDIVVYDKPADMAVHPTKKIQSGTLANSFYHHIKEGAGVFRPVYRLDKGTSGIVVVAKNKLAAHLLGGNIEKEYLCICEGELAESGTFEGAIGLSDNSKLKRQVRADGDSAVTHFERVSSSGGFSLARVWLETGRTHQIRVHFADDGHALVGDFLYGREYDEMPRHALHCGLVRFRHPITEQKMAFSTDLPEDMKKFIEKIGLYL